MHEHILAQLSLPDRYERLTSKLGADVAKILIPPNNSDVLGIRALATDVVTRDEGVLVPLFGNTGIGKTTFVENIGQWLPSDFTATMNYEGELTYQGLTEAVSGFSRKLPTNNRKLIPVNIDHRENNPPSDSELSAIKRFLRTNSGGVPSIIFWPETNQNTANALAERYVNISGETAIKLPIIWNGPERRTWINIAKHTLSLSNKIENLEMLGVDPDNFDPGSYPTLGAYLRKISQEFNAQVLKLRQELEKPVSLVIAFVSESNTPGVLSQLTSPSHYGLLDAHALISVTSQSVVGRWWSSRRGLLTRTIVQLNARAISLPPTAAASCIRNYTDTMPLFDQIGYRRYGPARAVRDLSRSDLGKLVSGEKISRFEARGTPPEDAAAAFDLLAQQGFNLGRDKNLNRVMRDSIEGLLTEKSVSFTNVSCETKLPFCPLIPRQRYSW
ncbi:MULTISPECIES: hypothetical protein [unclassified Shinella]|uniref:hypothetical protein n=1 Tax=unclassified Shinella TaxID=2643062 RepID=UPI00225C66D1|nr:MULTISPECIES: hypothetical protein [unclassified Shinella]MCO5138457.1 hypothetical protein [Shinella sp.]MDC7255293.1 hypothetical protein [Shinella sp. YE25]CAI0338065.1 conserved hypothetical protein [Rhizobiaceae bacterium]CAK7256525.1 ATP-binding protein [Shinella sp. WSC3-e]